MELDAQTIFDACVLQEMTDPAQTWAARRRCFRWPWISRNMELKPANPNNLQLGILEGRRYRHKTNSFYYSYRQARPF